MIVELPEPEQERLRREAAFVGAWSLEVSAELAAGVLGSRRRALLVQKQAAVWHLQAEIHHAVRREQKRQLGF